jgi:competence protein ComEC
MSRQADAEGEFLTAPLVALSASFALGIAVADAPRVSLAGVLTKVPWLLALAGLCMLAGLVLTRVRWPRLAGVLALAGFILSGSATAQLFEFRFSDRHISHLESLGIDLRTPVRVSGRIVSLPLPRPSGLQFDLDVSAIEDRGRVHPVMGKVRVFLRRGGSVQAEELGESLGLSYGDSIRALVRLDRPRTYRNPGVFDYRRWLASIHDIYWTGTIKSPLLVEKLPRQGHPTFGEVIARVRHRLLAGTDRLYPPWTLEGRDGAVLKAVLLGDRSSLDSKTMDDFRQAGLYHLLVISGLHVGLLAMLAALLLRLTPLGQAWRSALVLLFLLGYCSLVELRAPTTRATIMITAYLLARFFYRPHAALNAVGLAALALLVVRPPWLFESGFQLSFAAALMIVALIVPILQSTTEPWRLALRDVGEDDRDVRLAPRQAQLRLDVRRTARWVATRTPYLRNHPTAAIALVAFPMRVFVWTFASLVFTTILQVGLMLPLAATFHRVTFAGIGLNALAIPVMTVLLAVALPTVLLGAVWPAATVWPGKLLALIMNLLFSLTTWPHLPAWLSYRVPTPPAWVSWGFAISVVAAACSWGRHRRAFRISAASLVVFAAFISANPFPPRVMGGRLEVTALDCGSGGAFLVVLPDRTTLLIGAGGGSAHWRSEDPFESRRWSAAEEIVSPYLWSRQITKLDVVVMSRGDESHLAGYAAIARNFQIGDFWYSASALPPASLGFIDELNSRGIKTHAIEPGERMTRGSTLIQALWPREPESGTTSASSRNRGMVIRIQGGESSILFAGDSSSRTQQALLKSPSKLRAALLALAAPASFDDLDREFAASVSPRVVLVSGGAEDGEDFSGGGMPAEISPSAPRVFQTERNGAVSVEMRDGKILVRAYGMPAGEGTLGLESAASLTSSSRSVR